MTVQAIISTLNALSGHSFVPEREFFSRQNRVLLLCDGDTRCVLKLFVAGDREREAALLRRAEALAIPAPRLLHEGEGWLTMTYLAGPLLSELLDGDGDLPAAALARLFAHCHRVTESSDGTIEAPCDQNMRNFVCHDGEFFLLDLAETERLRPEAALGRFCADLLLFRPPFDARKRALVNEMLAAYNRLRGNSFDRALFRQELAAEARRLCDRRGGDYAKLPLTELLTTL